MTSVYDYIVVGSGSSGGVIATRLSENGKHTVLCLEAGTEGTNYIWTWSPLGGAFMIHDDKVNWNEFAQPNDELAGRKIHVPGGKILGGSSAINATVANRGQRRDYDGWAAQGCSGWSYQDVLPYFKKLEQTDIGDDAYRGRSGPIHISYAQKLTGFYDLFIASAAKLGLPYNPDYLGERQEGTAMAQLTSRRGRRHSTANRYLEPARRRRNLTIVQGAQATSLILEGKTCVGLRYLKDGHQAEVRARREVIVCCGTINSPKLLELSGIGRADILAPLGIECLHELPGVGENLRDHFGPMLKWSFTRQNLSVSDQGRGLKLVRELLRYILLGKGFIAQGLSTMRAFARTEPDGDGCDVQLLGNPYLIEVQGGHGMSGSHGKRSMSKTSGFYISTQVQRPESAGRTHILSSDPRQMPAVNYRFLATDYDRRVAIAGFRLARSIVAQEPLRAVVKEEISPGPSVQSDEEILDYCRRTGATTYHFVGTCKMGLDEMSVVDQRLRVRGLQGLRVADASIMPTLVSGNTSIPCMMIGEKAAAMILEDAA